MTDSPVHVLALVKGAVEGDVFQHFGSIFGLDRGTVADAVCLGLVDEHSQPTPLGRSFYIDANLASLPAGRANYWGTAAFRARIMLRELEQEIKP